MISYNLITRGKNDILQYKLLFTTLPSHWRGKKSPACCWCALLCRCNLYVWNEKDFTVCKHGLHISIHNCVFCFFPLQLLSQSRHTGAACPASDPWPSTVRLWETMSAWVRAVDEQRDWGARSRTAWCSAAARWGSRRGCVWGWRRICVTGTELCVWASPTCILQPDLCLCPQWPSPTSLTNLGTGPLPCMNPTAK